MREQANNNIANYTPEEKNNYNKYKLGCEFTIFVVFIVVCLLIIVVAGPEALIRWLK